MNIPPMPPAHINLAILKEEVIKFHKKKISKIKQKYRSYSHILKNECGEEEVRIEYHNNWLRNLLRLKTKSYVFVKSPYRCGFRWSHKYIGNFATYSDILEIEQVIECVRQQELYKEFMDISGTLGN